MASSVVEICNMALDYCNEKNITSLEEKTKQSEKCKMWYDVVRQDLLTNLNASFSIKRATLPEVADFTPIYGYSKAYMLPNDCLQVLNIGSPIDDNYYQIEGGYLYFDERYSNQISDLVNIRYIADVKEVAKFDSSFCDLLALTLAEKICYSLTEDENKANYLSQKAQQKYVDTSAKYGRDNKMIVINQPRYRRAKLYPEINDFNYPAK